MKDFRAGPTDAHHARVSGAGSIVMLMMHKSVFGLIQLMLMMLGCQVQFRSIRSLIELIFIM